MSIISVKDLCVSYNRIPALCDVSLKIEKGQYVCLVGNNGSGKSTLLKTVVGLIKPDSGSVKINTEWGNVSYLPQQNPVQKGFPATVREVVLTGTQKPDDTHIFYTREDKRLADEAMEKTGIAQIMQKRVGSLSGGQQQRVMLARAICRCPQLLLLDEPCAGLDINITREIYGILSDYNKSGVTVVMVSHDMEEIGQYASRVIVMNQRVEFDGNNREWHFYHHHRRCDHE